MNGNTVFFPQQNEIRTGIMVGFNIDDTVFVVVKIFSSDKHTKK